MTQGIFYESKYVAFKSISIKWKKNTQFASKKIQIAILIKRLSIQYRNILIFLWFGRIVANFCVGAENVWRMKIAFIIAHKAIM